MFMALFSGSNTLIDESYEAEDYPKMDWVGISACNKAYLIELENASSVDITVGHLYVTVWSARLLWKVDEAFSNSIED